MTTLPGSVNIFYQLLAGASEEERKALGLRPVEDFAFVNQGGDPHVPHVDDAKEFKLTRDSLTTIGVSEETQSNIWKILAALLHLGNMEITGVRNGSSLSPTEENR